MKHTRGKVKHGQGLPMTGATTPSLAPFGNKWPYTAIMQGYEVIALLPAQDKNRMVGKSPEMDIVVMDANAKRIESFWNASDGMPTERAVKFLEHGAEMEQDIKSMRNMMEEQINNKVRGGRVQYVHVFQTALDTFNNILAKLEGK